MDAALVQAEPQHQTEQDVGQGSVKAPLVEQYQHDGHANSTKQVRVVKIGGVECSHDQNGYKVIHNCGCSEKYTKFDGYAIAQKYNQRDSEGCVR